MPKGAGERVTEDWVGGGQGDGEPAAKSCGNEAPGIPSLMIYQGPVSGSDRGSFEKSNEWATRAPDL